VVRQNSRDIQQLQAAVAQLRRDFEQRRELARMDDLDRRMARLEAKVGLAS
jgi:hypothetical protein